MTWDVNKLRQLAAAEEKAFLNARMNRLYWAMSRYEDVLRLESAEEGEARRELDKALDDLTEADIRRHMVDPVPPDGIYENMLEYKQSRELELQRRAQQTGTRKQESEEDSEPEQSM